jgi:hypothetical protein
LFNLHVANADTVGRKAPVVDEVRTIAGNGTAGLSDGPSAKAQFLLPSGLALGRDGTLFISDEAGQRIRSLSKDGYVRTVAGSGQIGALGLSVPGGYADGAALRARFNRPNGIAVMRDGSLLIADSGNACIRRLKDGVVSTFSGKAGEHTAVDGPSETARFADPRAIAIDKDGQIYVADFGIGLRRIDSSGVVSTIKFASNGDIRLIGLTIANSEGSPAVFASTPDQLLVYHPDTKLDEAYPTNGSESGSPFGQLNQLYAFDSRQLLFSDLKSSSIRYGRLPRAPFVTTMFSRAIAGQRSEAGTDNAGFADGSLQSSRFNAPRGLVVSGNTAIIADAGNRRIRAVSLPQLRISETGPVDTAQYDTSHLQIAYIGQSTTFWDVLGTDSFCAKLERSFDNSPRSRKPARCHSIRIDSATFAQIKEFISNYLSYQHIDVIVVAMNPSLANTTAPPEEKSWSAIGADLQTATRDLLSMTKQMHAQVAYCWNYYPSDISDSEDLYNRQLYAINSTSSQFPEEHGFHHSPNVPMIMEPGLAALGIPQYDSYDDFLRAELLPRTAPLFLAEDTHLSDRGVALLAEGCARYLLQHNVGVSR